jgi:anti-sigma factor RsiW
MSACDLFRPLLVGEKAGDLTPRQQEELRGHLGGCRSCSDESRQMGAILDALRETYHEKHHLDPSVRLRVAADAARQAGSSPWFLPYPLQQLAQPRYVLAMAAAVAFVAGLSLYSNLGNRTVAAGEVAQVDVVADHGVVRLAWTDGRKESYTVRKSHDPRGRASDKEYVVRGNVWTDIEPDSSPVVFYRIN